MSSKRSIRVLAHNIRSLWNIGSLFRTADAMNVEHIYLTGYTAAPPRKEIKKTALGAETWISWSKHEKAEDAISDATSNGYTIIALEKTHKSISIKDVDWPQKVCIIVGHEIDGVADELLQHADVAVHIPMLGKKESLNVSVAAGIALYTARQSS